MGLLRHGVLVRVDCVCAAGEGVVFPGAAVSVGGVIWFAGGHICCVPPFTTTTPGTMVLTLLALSATALQFRVVLLRDVGRRGVREFVQGVCVDCGDDVEVVLVFEEVVGRCDVQVVEGLGDFWEVGAEGEFVYAVGEVECCVLGCVSVELCMLLDLGCELRIEG